MELGGDYLDHSFLALGVFYEQSSFREVNKGMSANVGMHILVFSVVFALFYGSVVGRQIREAEHTLKKEEKVLRDCYNKVENLCKENKEAKGKVHKVCGLMVNNISIWGDYSCQPFEFYASGNYYIMQGKTLKLRRW